MWSRSAVLVRSAETEGMTAEADVTSVVAVSVETEGESARSVVSTAISAKSALAEVPLVTRLLCRRKMIQKKKCSSFRLFRYIEDGRMKVLFTRLLYYKRGSDTLNKLRVTKKSI